MGWRKWLWPKALETQGGQHRESCGFPGATDLWGLCLLQSHEHIVFKLGLRISMLVGERVSPTASDKPVVHFLESRPEACIPEQATTCGIKALVGLSQKFGDPSNLAKRPVCRCHSVPCTCHANIYARVFIHCHMYIYIYMHMLHVASTCNVQ